MTALAWGARVSPLFRAKAISISNGLRIYPSWLMACIAFETGETFSPSIRNASGSGAVGLIQFMPSTAAALGTSVESLASMSAEDQLSFVASYFKPWTGRLHSLGDVYGAILWPGMIGKQDAAVIFDADDVDHPKFYLQNRGLDLDRNRKITKAEIVARVSKELDRGMLPQNSFEV